MTPFLNSSQEPTVSAYLSKLTKNCSVLTSALFPMTENCFNGVLLVFGVMGGDMVDSARKSQAAYCLELSGMGTELVITHLESNKHSKPN